MTDLITKFVRDDSGANTIEYSLLAALALVGGVLALESLGVSLDKFFNWAGIMLVILLLTGSVAAAFYLYARRREMTCRWRRLSAKDSPPFKGWVCRHCGEEAYTRDRWPPKECSSVPGRAI